MEFPKDQDLFKDIKPDGTLETPDILAKMVKDSAYAEFSYALRRANDALPSSVRNKEDAVKTFSRQIFASAAEAACQFVKGGYIGMFPFGTFTGKKYGTEEDYSQVKVYVEDQLEHYQPAGVCIADMQEVYTSAVSAKKERRSTLVAILFLLLNAAIVALAALSLLPGLEPYRLIGRGWDWAVVLAALLSLVLAWCFHLPCNNEWSALGFIHALLVLLSLLWQVEEFESAENIIILSGVTLLVSLIALIHYLVDGVGSFVRWRINEFKKWCDEDALENYRKLRFLILWYRNVVKEKKTPFDAMQDEFFTLLEKRKEF